MTYEELLSLADSAELIVKEKPLQGNDGRISGNRIAIKKDLNTSAEKACVLAEELGHHYTTVGDILNQSIVENQKQEHTARMWAYDSLIGLYGIIDCYKAKCQNKHEMAEYLNITEAFLTEALENYRNKFGKQIYLDNYIIYFEPSLSVEQI